MLSQNSESHQSQRRGCWITGWHEVKFERVADDRIVCMTFASRHCHVAEIMAKTWRACLIQLMLDLGCVAFPMS